MNKDDRDLTRAAKKSFLRVSRDVRKLIEKGLAPGMASSGTTWGRAHSTYVHLALGHGRLNLDIVVGETQVAKVSRSAKRAGVRRADIAALDKFVKDGPAIIVKRLSSAVKDVENVLSPDPVVTRRHPVSGNVSAGCRRRRGPESIEP